jgi:flavodoxin I
MSKIIMVYASMTGNTLKMAEALEEGIRAEGVDIEVKEAVDTFAAELENYDGILLGAYTWGDGELPDEFLDFYDEMDGLDLTGKKAAVFGSCDSGYSHYGAAVDILTEKLKELGADVVLEGLKIELTPSDSDKKICENYGREFVKHLLSDKN